MRGGTLFSGIGAPEQAMPWVDWRWSAESNPLASAVLAVRHPKTRNLGDVTKVDWNEIARTEPVDLMVFGSPCQSFSLAGKRRGMDDARGNLALVALGVVRTVRPRWFVFENVPGLLSSANGRDFGALLGQVEECGYGWAFRTIDAWFYGLPQRRRRLFLVGYRSPVSNSGDWRGAAAVLYDASCLQQYPPQRGETQANAARTAPKSIGECSVYSFQPRIGRCGRGQPSTVVPALAGSNAGATSDSRPCVVIFDCTRGDYIVRRLTPRECERLQGFPDDYTLIPFQGKPLTDSQRYQVLGNSMAVPVISWLGRRIAMMDALIGCLHRKIPRRLNCRSTRKGH